MWHDGTSGTPLEGVYHASTGLELIIPGARTKVCNGALEECMALQESIGRRRKHEIEAMAEQLQLKPVVFDILYKDGVSLLDTPIAERLKILEEKIEVEDFLM